MLYVGKNYADFFPCTEEKICCVSASSQAPLLTCLLVGWLSSHPEPPHGFLSTRFFLMIGSSWWLLPSHWVELFHCHDSYAWLRAPFLPEVLLTHKLHHPPSVQYSSIFSFLFFLPSFLPSSFLPPLLLGSCPPHLSYLLGSPCISVTFQNTSINSCRLGFELDLGLSLDQILYKLF